MSSKPRLLINLPPTFFSRAELKPHFDRLEKMAGQVRKTSYNLTEEIMRDLPWAEAVIMWAWPGFGDEELKSCPDLNFLGQINTSGQHARACLKKGIALSDVRYAWSPSVAELALVLAMSGLRQTSAYHIAMTRGNEHWIKDFPADIDARERQLAGRSVGIVGFGGIGQHLANLLKPFNVTLRVYDPYLPADVPARFGARPVELMELASESEVVVLCAAPVDSAQHMIDAKVIEAFQKDAVLVNVGRSVLIDMAALQERLQKGDLIAMLDVHDQEPLPADSPLRSLPNTYLTPHVAGGILASLDRALTWLADDLEAHLNGQPRKYAVTDKMLASFPG
jgi:phosphoglycerate dehydrogenase-like enzyme